MLRLSTLFLRTLRDDPADAEVPSHKLLVRAGYIRRWAPGIYSKLPLGQIIQDNIARIVDEEMQAFGAQKVTFPALLPREYYEQTGRWTEYGDTLFRLKDRRGNDFLLGPTHEELFTLTVKDLCNSYKDLPVILYQIQTKYRDEARPRSGILRGREFEMKDSYSFDITDEGLEVSYNSHRVAYEKIFKRLGINYRIVSATSGAMGGSQSEEFLAPSPVGEDTFVQCASCHYAANVEAVNVDYQTKVANLVINFKNGRHVVEAEAHKQPGTQEGTQEGTQDGAENGDIEITSENLSELGLILADAPSLVELETPDAPGISLVVQHLKEHHANEIASDLSAGDLLKNIVFKLDGTPIIVLVPGDREVDVDKLEAAIVAHKLGEKLEPFEEADFGNHPNLVKGYISAIGMTGSPIRIFSDPRVVPGSSWVTGANKSQYHVVNAIVGRDFHVDHYFDVATVADGDPCPNCRGPLTSGRGIEIGHIFQLGRKYADAFSLDVLGPQGKPVRVTMGSYGIGVSRAVAVIAEQYHDEKGLVWPASVAPAFIHIVATGKDNQIETALELGTQLEKLGIKCLVDDRPSVSPGVKFKDAELLGMPNILVVGKGLAEGIVELKDRATGESQNLPLDAVVATIVALNEAQIH